MSTTGMFVIFGILATCAGLVALGKAVERRREHRREQGEIEALIIKRFGGRHRAEPRPIMAVVVDPLTERELLAARADHGAESLALRPDMFRETQDDQAAAIWRANFDWYAARVGERADALAREAEAIGTGLLDDFDVEMAAYDEKIAMLLERFAAGTPEVALAVVSTEAELADPVFTWTTGEYSTVLSVPPVAERVRVAESIAKAHAAMGYDPVTHYYERAGFVHA